MRSMWPKLKAIADTRPYDGAIVRDNQRGKPQPTKRWAPVTIPALVVDGRKSLTWMRHTSQSLAAALPNAHYRTLEGQTHMLKPRNLECTSQCWWSFSMVRGAVDADSQRNYQGSRSGQGSFFLRIRRGLRQAARLPHWWRSIANHIRAGGPRASNWSWNRTLYPRRGQLRRHYMTRDFQPPCSRPTTLLPSTGVSTAWVLRFVVSPGTWGPLI